MDVKRSQISRSCRVRLVEEEAEPDMTTEVKLAFLVSSLSGNTCDTKSLSVSFA